MSRPHETYLSEHREQHLEQLKEFLRFPSISTLPEHRSDVLNCAHFLADHVRSIGFENVSVMPTDGHPVVYADWLHAPGKPTVLVYGHYDVQPVDPLDLWETPPFEPVIRGQQLFARGATDDKGPVFMHLKAFESLFQTTGSLPINVKLCFEGEEEIGSANFPKFIEKNVDHLKADIVVISDTSMAGPNQPSICYGLRGLAGMQVDVKGPKGDLHSGLYGGAVQNPIHALTQILHSMRDESGHIVIDEFYDDVVTLTEEERAAFRQLGFDEQALATEIQVPALFGETGYTVVEQTGARPTVEINGIWGGFQGEGSKTIIPSEAHAKITCRLVPNQTPENILTLVQRHVEKHTPPGVTVRVTWLDRGNPFVTPIDHPAIQLASEAYEYAYNVPAVFTRMGGSIAVVELFGRLLGTPVVMMGFSLNDENFHAPNEHFSLENYDKGLRALCYYWNKVSDVLANV